MFKLIRILKEINMNFVAFTAAITQLSTDIQALIAQGAGGQAQIDAATASVTALDATVKAALPPPAAPVTPAA
jgi:hypothetical protein